MHVTNWGQSNYYEGKKGNLGCNQSASLFILLFYDWYLFGPLTVAKTVTRMVGVFVRLLYNIERIRNRFQPDFTVIDYDRQYLR